MLMRSRKSLSDSIFKVFCQSVDTANIKKQNSLILFLVNLRDLNERADSLRSSIDNYKAMAKGFRKPIEAGQSRNKVNAWVEGTLAYTIEQRRKDKHEPNCLQLYLFRLLTIKYRSLYPLKGSPVKLDRDLEDLL
jgi:hypothetical protein